MASEVLSGPSNPSYTNNKGQNVRIVINYMKSKRTNIGEARVAIGSGIGFSPIFRESLVINWAGVSAGYTQDGRAIPVTQTGGQLGQPSGPNVILQPLKVVIGRNLSYVIGQTRSGRSSIASSPSVANNAAASQVYTGNTPFVVSTPFNDVPFSINVDDANIEGLDLDDAAEPVAFPTELILAPGQTFSAVCGVYNIVVIPENG